jgi:hypothetical protein
MQYRDDPLLRARRTAAHASAERRALPALRCARRSTAAFVRRARKLGFTLDQVRALPALSPKDGRDACREVHDIAAEHLGEVRAKIADLRAMERILADAVRRCAAGELPGCPIIDALSGDRVENKNSNRSVK